MTKYHAKKVKADGYTFDSIAEYNRYHDLKLRQEAGEITGLQVHPRYVVDDGFVSGDEKFRDLYYVADFTYNEIHYPTMERVVEDVKGVRTQVYRIKRRLFLRRYPDADFREIEAY